MIRRSAQLPAVPVWPLSAPQVVLPLDDDPDYLGRHWSALKRYWWVALAIVALGLAVTATWISLIHPLYSATATVMIDPRGAQAGAVINPVSNLPLDVDTVTNEVQMVTSRNLLTALVRELDLVHDPYYDMNRIGPVRARLQSLLAMVTPYLPPPIEARLRASIVKPVLHGSQFSEAVINQVTDSLDVGPLGRSRAIAITFKSGDSALSARLANTLARLYLANQGTMKRDAAEAANRRINDQLVELRSAAADAAQRVEGFRAGSGLTEGRDTTLVRQQISEVRTQLTAAELDSTTTASRVREVERAAARPGADASAEVMRSPLIQQLSIQQAQAARELAHAQVVYGERHANAQIAAAQVNTINGRIQQEVQKTAAAVRGEHEAAVDRASALRVQLDKLKQEMATMRTNEVHLDQLIVNAHAANGIYETFLRRAIETHVGSSMQFPDAYIISQATVPSGPNSPNSKLAFPVGVAVSLALASLAVLLLEGRDLGFRNQSHVARVLGLPTIGLIPELRRRSRTRELAPEPLSLAGTAITDLYMRIALAPEIRCVLVASALPGEGKTMIGLILAQAAAVTGKRALYVDCDMRRRRFGRSGQDRPGLAELLQGRISLEEAVDTDDSAPGIAFMTAGAPVANPVGLICSREMRDLLSTARLCYDLVIIDSPPILAGPDAWALALLADTTLLLVKWASTPCKVVLAAYQRLIQPGARVSGVVMTWVNPRRLARDGSADTIQFSPRLKGYFKRYSA
jgi:succinoglycan biosynthesis transport protein ExoP